MDNFRSPKVVKLEREIQALKAMGNAYKADILSVLSDMGMQCGDGESQDAYQIMKWADKIERAFDKTPQQSLDTLKAEIEEDVIERCKDEIVTQLREEGNQNGMMAFGMTTVSQAISNMPRKYQSPTNENQIGSKNDK